MSFDPADLKAAGLDAGLLEVLIEEHEQRVVPRLERLWDYYRNAELEEGFPGRVGRGYRLAQQQGLPTRLGGSTDLGESSSFNNVEREVVIENDIGWRINTLVDFMFGKPVVLQSLAPRTRRPLNRRTPRAWDLLSPEMKKDGGPHSGSYGLVAGNHGSEGEDEGPAPLQSRLAAEPSSGSKADLIELFLREVIEANGGVSFYQELALLGSVHGYVDVLLRVDPAVEGMGLAGEGGTPEATRWGVAADGVRSDPLPYSRGSRWGASGDDESVEARVIRAARGFVLEVVEAPRAVPVLSEDDYRKLDAYLVHWRQQLNEVEEDGLLSRAGGGLFGARPVGNRRAEVEYTAVWTDRVAMTFKGTGSGRVLVEEEANRLGRIPIVHIQNLPQPFFYEGLSEVEPLIPLQDELNTRLSDRANRVTFQSFKMYLGKGIEKFTERPIGPGQMWATDNPEASIEEFGGDAASPSEEAHINQIREAMDKTSSVTPLAAGLIRSKIGNLTSENALRITLMGVLAKTEKKRVTYGAGIQRLCELILHAADVYGVLPNGPEERRVRLDWPGILPENETQRLQDAKVKLELGVPREQVLTELGYEGCTPTGSPGSPGS